MNFSDWPRGIGEGKGVGDGEYFKSAHYFKLVKIMARCLIILIRMLVADVGTYD